MSTEASESRKPFPILGSCILFATIYAAMRIAAHLLAAALAASLPAVPPWMLSVPCLSTGVGLIYIVLLPYAFWCVRMVADSSALDSIFSRPDASGTMLGAICGLLGLVLTYAIMLACSHFDFSVLVNGGGSANVPVPLLATFALSAVVIVPVLEELTFRVFAYNAIKRWAGVPIAIVLSAGLFCVLHGPNQRLGAFCGGLFFAYAYERSRSMWSSVFAHAIFNVPLVALAVLGR